MTTLTPGQLAQQHNRTADGRYAEGQHADPGNLDLVVPICPRCGGEWGRDETCAHCTDANGDPRPVNQPGPLHPDDEKEIMRAEAQWGQTGAYIGCRTPWGKADSVNPLAPGIVSVSTPGHGGVKLSPERNREIPLPLRRQSGWYEEDCERDIVMMVHPEAFGYLGKDPEEVRAIAKAGVINWFPDAYEKVTGETVEFGQSTVRDAAVWEQQTAGQPKLFTTGATEHPDYPGTVVVTTRAGDGRFTRHMIPVADYQAADAKRRFGAADVNPLLPASAVEVPEAGTRKPPRPAVTTLAAAANERSSKTQMELDKPWRDQTGRVFTLRQDIEAGKFCAKIAYYNNGRWSYSLNHTGNESLATPVSKVVWDAFQGPDTREPVQVARQNAEVKRVAYERALAEPFDNRTYDKHREKVRRAKEAYDAAAHEADRLSNEAVARGAEERARREADDKAALDAAYAQLKARG